MSTLAALAFSNAKRVVGGSRWIPVRKIDHFLGLFFPVPSRVVCVCARVLKDPARRGMILPRPRVHQTGLDDFLFINSKKTIPLMAAFPPGVWV
jgi:hypothetical protein